MAHYFQAGEGALFAQINGPNTQPVYLGCHQLGDIDEPSSDVELMYCPDKSGPNAYKVVGSIRGAAGAPTTSITTAVTDELDELERVKNCAINIYVNLLIAGRKDLFTNADRTIIFSSAVITSRGMSGLTSRSPDDNAASEQTFDLTGESVLRAIVPTMARQSITETSNINDITFCNSEACRTSEDIAQGVCEDGFAVTDAPTGSPSTTANVLKTTNGSTWTATTSDPFAVTEDIIAVECFEVSRNSVRVIVARGTTDGANPAEIAYSDDSGTTWSAVDVGAVNGQYAPSRFSLFAFDRNNIWLGTDDGYIYISEDAGLTWTAQDAGVVSSNAWNAVHFVTEDVGYIGGDSNSLAKTVDGGVSWSSVTGPTAEAGNAVTTVFTIDKNRAWIGYDSGTLYYTLDAGVTWTARSFTGSGVGQVRDISFINENIGILASNNASPVGTAHYTKDGGYTWEAMTTPTNVGINVVHICDIWNFYAAGEAQGGTGYIAKGTV